MYWILCSPHDMKTKRIQYSADPGAPFRAPSFDEFDEVEPRQVKCWDSSAQALRETDSM